MAISASIRLSRKLTLTRCAFEPSTAFLLTSAPVPAVVGSAMKGNGGSTASLLPVAYDLQILEYVSPALGISAALALPVSMTLPPPMLITRSQPADADAIALASSITATVGSPLTGKCVSRRDG